MSSVRGQGEFGRGGRVSSVQGAEGVRHREQGELSKGSRGCCINSAHT